MIVAADDYLIELWAYDFPADGMGSCLNDFEIFGRGTGRGPFNDQFAPSPMDTLDLAKETAVAIARQPRSTGANGGEPNVAPDFPTLSALVENFAVPPHEEVDRGQLAILPCPTPVPAA